MRRQRISVEPIVAVLRQGELGMPVADLIGKVGITEQTFKRWKKQNQIHYVRPHGPRGALRS